MTVIASDGITIAADGLSIYGHSEIGAGNIRKIVVEDKTVYAFSGAFAMMRPMINWYKAGYNPREVPPASGDVQWNMLVIDRDGPTLFGNHVPYSDRQVYPVTLGTGGDYAMAILLDGGTSRRAVEIACMKDAFCGGEIQVVNIAEALGIPRLEAAE